MLINAAMGLAAAAALYAGARRYLGRPVALLAAVLFYTLPGAWDYNYAGMPDLGVSLYLFLSVFLFREWLTQRRRRDLFLAGLCAGFAASVKIIGLYAVFAIGVLLLWSLARGRDRSHGCDRSHDSRARLLLLFAAGLLISGAPWYVRNWLTAGNPVWPMFYPWLGGRCWNAAAYQAGLDLLAAGASALGRTLPDFLTGPLSLAAGFAPAPLFNPPGVGPLFLAFLPIALCLPDIRRQEGPILAAAALYYVAWFPFAQYGRYILPVYALLCVLLAHVLQRLAYVAPDAGPAGLSRRLLRLAAVGSVVVWIDL